MLRNSLAAVQEPDILHYMFPSRSQTLEKNFSNLVLHYPDSQDIDRIIEQKIQYVPRLKRKTYP
ncbi:hypothetical protein D9M72_457980 [compost metagenome]